MYHTRTGSLTKTHSSKGANHHHQYVFFSGTLRVMGKVTYICMVHINFSIIASDEVTVFHACLRLIIHIGVFFACILNIYHGEYAFMSRLLRVYSPE